MTQEYTHYLFGKVYASGDLSSENTPDYFIFPLNEEILHTMRQLSKAGQDFKHDVFPKVKYQGRDLTAEYHFFNILSPFTLVFWEIEEYTDEKEEALSFLESLFEAEDSIVILCASQVPENVKALESPHYVELENITFWHDGDIFLRAFNKWSGEVYESYSVALPDSLEN